MKGYRNLVVSSKSTYQLMEIRKENGDDNIPIESNLADDIETYKLNN